MGEPRFHLAEVHDDLYTVFRVVLYDTALLRKHTLYAGPVPPKADKRLMFQLQRDRFNENPTGSFQLRPWRPMEGGDKHG